MRFKIIGVLIIPALFGCAVRDEIVRVREQLNYIEESNRRTESGINQLDSLSREEIELIMRFRAEHTTSLSKIEDNIESTRNAVNELSGISVTQKGDTSIPSNVYSIAYSDYLLGNYDLAISGFLSYINSIPNLDEARYFLGGCYLEKGDYANAIKSFDMVAQDFPQSKRAPTALFKIGRIYETMGDTTAANRYFERLSRDYPDSPEAALLKGSK
jgi:tol-pal system protein YbgF